MVCLDTSTTGHMHIYGRDIEWLKHYVEYFLCKGTYLCYFIHQRAVIFWLKSRATYALRHPFNFVCETPSLFGPPRPWTQWHWSSNISPKSIDAYQGSEPKISYQMASVANKLNIYKKSVIIRWCIQRGKNRLLQYSSYKFGDYHNWRAIQTQ
jgi:hypothetical protein